MFSSPILEIIMDCSDMVLAWVYQTQFQEFLFVVQDNKVVNCYAPLAPLQKQPEDINYG